MSKPTTVLGNLLSHFPRSEFEKAVQELDGDKGVRTLSCFDMVKTLLYGQVRGAFSVREIESSLVAHGSELYHAGMKPVRRSTLCDALEKRNPAIFEKAFQALVFKAQQLSSKSGRRFRNPLRVIDASTIEVCLARFDWAKFRTTKGAVKLHVCLDGDHCFPQQVRITTGAVHEVRELSALSQEGGMIYVVDRGYVDFKRLHDIDLSMSTFVTRMKDNCQYDHVTVQSFSQTGPIRFDAKVRLTGEKAQKDYPEPIRKVNYHDEETNRDYQFMTNNFDLEAQEVAEIYKARWQVELFFKWIKQNLKIRTFWGTSRNAVFTQLWVALIVFMLLWISKTVDAVAASPQRILQLLKTLLLARRSFLDLFRDPAPPHPVDTLQLSLLGFRN